MYQYKSTDLTRKNPRLDFQRAATRQSRLNATADARNATHHQTPRAQIARGKGEDEEKRKYEPQRLAGAAGLEPATLGFGDRCSTKLSYAPATATPNFTAYRPQGQPQTTPEKPKPAPRAAYDPYAPRKHRRHQPAFMAIIMRPQNAPRRPISRVLSRRHCAGGGHLSSPVVADEVMLPTRGRAGRPMLPLLGIAPDGVCLASDVATGAVRSYRAFSPLPPQETQPSKRRSVSVALSVGSLRPAVSGHPRPVELGLSSRPHLADRRPPGLLDTPLL